MEPLTEERKAEIDNMDYESMLRRNRFSSAGDTIFQGDTGTYFMEQMAKKRAEVGPAAAVRASKNIGWD